MPACRCLSSHPLGGLVARSAPPRLDPLATQPSGHGGSPARFPTFLDVWPAHARSARPLALDVATTARTQCTIPHGAAYPANHLWALTGVCSGPRCEGCLN